MHGNYNFLNDFQLYRENKKNLEGDEFYDTMAYCYGKYDEAGLTILC